MTKSTDRQVSSTLPYRRPHDTHNGSDKKDSGSKLYPAVSPAWQKVERSADRAVELSQSANNPVSDFPICPRADTAAQTLLSPFAEYLWLELKILDLSPPAAAYRLQLFPTDASVVSSNARDG